MRRGNVQVNVGGGYLVVNGEMHRRDESAKSDAGSYVRKENFQPKGKGYDEIPENEPASDAMPDSAPC